MSSMLMGQQGEKFQKQIFFVLAVVLVVILIFLGINKIYYQNTGEADRVDYHFCQSEMDCMGDPGDNGCGGIVCANKKAFESNDPEFQALLGVCLDASTPAEQGFVCACNINKCEWGISQKDAQEITTAVVGYTENNYPPCNRNETDVSDIKFIGKGYFYENMIASAHMACSCGKECGYSCDFQINRDTQQWVVEDKEYKCVTLIEKNDVNVTDQDIKVMTLKLSYFANDEVIVTIENSLDDGIWTSPSCGSPFTLQKHNGLEWENYGPDPTKSCYAPSQKIESFEKRTYILNLKQIYEHTFFRIEPGRYQFLFSYSLTDPTLVGQRPQYFEVFSNEFTIEKEVMA